MINIYILIYLIVRPWMFIKKKKKNADIPYVEELLPFKILTSNNDFNFVVCCILYRISNIIN